MTGRPAPRTSGCATRLVSGRSRVPFPASGTMTFMSRPPVAVFEPHDVVDLGGGSLEQVGRGHGLELVDQLRLDVERRALRHGPLDQSVSLLDAEHDLAREHVDGLVLLVVVLEREHVAGLDVKDLPDVAVRAGPNQLVAPGLFDAVGEVGHGRRETRNAKRGTRNSRVGAVASDLALLFRVPTSAFRVLMKSAST